MPMLPLSANLLIFALAAGIVWFSGSRLTYLVDTLSDRLHLAKSLMGLLVLSLATSLPEVATTLSAAVQQSRALVLNNLFGGIALQTAILATADLWAQGAITNYPRKANHALEATLLVVLLSLTLVVLLMGDPLAIGHVGSGSVLVALTYAGTIWLLRHYDDASDWIPVDLPDIVQLSPPPAFRNPEGISVRMLVFQAALACLAILIFGMALVWGAGNIAEQSGLGTGFVGVTLLAGATSLPELTTSITAVRMGAYTLAISNIFGSNLIMLVLVFPADLLFVEGPILRDAELSVPLAVCFGMMVTGVFLVGMIVRRKPRIGALGLDSAIVLIIYAVSILAYYLTR